MWRFRAMVITGVLFGMLLFGAISAHGFWWWNAKIDVAGVELATVWEVADAEGPGAPYFANISVAVPKNADAEITEQADNEKVGIRHTRRLKCREDGIETVVKLRVKSHSDDDSSDDGDSNDDDERGVRLILKADGEEIGRGEGEVGERIVARGLLPTDGRAC